MGVSVRVTTALTLLTLLALLALVSCSDSRPPVGRFGSEPNGTSGGDAGAGSSGFGGTNGGAGGATCATATTFVYVVGNANELYRFEPDSKKLTLVGTLACPSSGATPNSMAVDRSGTAWVNFSDGSLFSVSTADASCRATSFRPQHGFQRFGMAFATNGANTDEETLYVAGISGQSMGQGLAKIDLTTMVLSPIGDYSGSLHGKGAELTGTGDGRLYGFFTTQPNATLAQIDTATGATSNVSVLEGLSTGVAWAFSFWGGDFWFYTSQAFEPSKVTRKATSAGGAISTALASVGDFEIVGAGVSTCAPITPPK